MASLIVRLESVTAKAEAFFKSHGTQLNFQGINGTGETPGRGMVSLIARLETVTAKLEALFENNPTLAVDNNNASAVVAYDKWVSTFVDQFSKLSKQIDSLVFEAAELAVKTLVEQRKIVAMASRCAKPKDLPLLYQPLYEVMSEAQSFGEKFRSSEFYMHLMAIDQFVALIGWLTTAKPAEFVKDNRDRNMKQGY